LRRKEKPAVWLIAFERFCFSSEFFALDFCQNKKTVDRLKIPINGL